MKLLGKTLVTVAAVVSVTAIARHHETVVEIAAGNDNFSTLVSLVQEADLVEALSGDGPFTVFAPTNAAFSDLGDETLQLVKEDKALLAKILAYHVVSGKITSDMICDESSYQTLEGSSISISCSDIDGSTLVQLNDENIISAVDLTGTNGVVHVIDKVLIPAE